MLYGKVAAERHSEAIDALESCLSPACAHSPYKTRLDSHKDAVLELVDMFDRPETQFEHTELLRLVVSLLDGEYFSGFQVLRYQSSINRLRKRVKGRLMFTRSILADKDKNPNTAKKNFAKFKLDEESNDAQA